MTVKKLIEELQKHDPDKLVLVTAYEEGFDELEKVHQVEVRYKPKKNYWQGNYDDYPLDKCSISAILLPRP